MHSIKANTKGLLSHFSFITSTRPLRIPSSYVNALTHDRLRIYGARLQAIDYMHSSSVQNRSHCRKFLAHT